jgi:hypothetical protein
MSKRQAKVKVAPMPTGIIAFPSGALPRTPRTVALAKLLATITREYVQEAA